MHPHRNFVSACAIPKSEEYLWSDLYNQIPRFLGKSTCKALTDFLPGTRWTGRCTWWSMSKVLRSFISTTGTSNLMNFSLVAWIIVCAWERWSVWYQHVPPVNYVCIRINCHNLNSGYKTYVWYIEVSHMWERWLEITLWPESTLASMLESITAVLKLSVMFFVSVCAAWELYFSHTPGFLSPISYGS